MTTGQKNAVSLLVSLVLFATFSMVAYSGLFSFIETRFYQPAKIQQIRQKLDGISDCYDSYISSIFQKIETYCESKEFFSYMEQQASDSLVRERTRLTGELFNSIPALSGIRIVDVNGRNVHFSTFSADFLRNSENLRSYRNYLDLKNPLQQPEIPFENISFSNILSDGKNGEKNDRKYRFFADSECDRLIISLPVYDSYKVLKASAVFYLNSMDFNRELLKTNIVAVSDSSDFLNLADGKSGLYGYVFGLPVAGRQMLENLVLASWQTTGDGPERLASYENGFWVLFSSRKSSFAVISGVYRDEIFAMPYSVRILLLVCAFISLFLVVCLLVSLKHDDLVVIRSRIRRFQFAVVNEYLNDKMEIDWKATAKSIYDRKGEISDSIRRSLGKRRLKKYSREIDELLEKSWNEIFNVLNVRSGAEIAASATEKLKDTAELRQMLEEILSNTSIKVHSIQAPLAHAEAAELTEPAEVADEVEEAEVAELAEPAELADEVEEAEVAELAESAEVADEVKPCKEIHSFENECAGFDSDGKLSDTVEIGSNDGFEIADLDFSDLDKEENSTLPENPVAAESAKSVESAEQTLEAVTESSDYCGKKNENFLQDSKVILEKAEKKKTGRGLLAVASALANLNAKNILKTENSMNQQRFLTRKASDELLKFRKESAVKSGRDFDGTLLNTGFDSFSFTQFAANNQAVSELCMADEPIVDEGNGLFHISERLDTHGVKQNSDFKKLVESVIRL